jgi:hypothetical protein
MEAGSWYRRSIALSKYFRPPCNVLVVPRVAAPPPGDKTIALSFLRKEFLMSSAFQVSARTGQARELPQAGLHQACAIALLGIGTHPTTRDPTEDGKVRTAYQLVFGWELVDDDKRPVILQKYNKILGQRSHLHGLLVSWQVARPPILNIDLAGLLGRHALLVIQHGTSQTGRAFAKAGFPTPLMAGMTTTPPKFKPFSWAVEDGTPVPAAIDDLPWLLGERLSDWIARAPETVALRQRRADRSTQAGGGTPAGGGAPANGDADKWVAGEDDDDPAF